MTESFRARVEQMDTNGGTALFEAISESADLVVAKEQELVKRHAATDAKQEALTLPKKRILVMSDGDDQDSPSRKKTTSNATMKEKQLIQVIQQQSRSTSPYSAPEYYPPNDYPKWRTPTETKQRIQQRRTLI